MSRVIKLLVGKPWGLSLSSGKRTIIELLNLVVSTSTFLSINAALVTVFSFLIYGVEVRPVIFLISFLATFSVYNMNRATDKAEDSINRPDAAIKGSHFYLVLSLTALLLCLALSVSVGVKTISVLAVPLIASIAYSVKLRPSFPRLKDIIGVKSIVVAFSWGFTGTFLPCTVYTINFTEKILVFVYVFIQIFVNTVLCDVRDINGDRATGIKTLPIVLGLDRVKSLLLAVNSLLFPWLAICIVNRLFLEYLPALIFGTVYGYILILVFTNNGRSRLLTDLAIDGEWIPLLALMKLL